MATTIKQLAEDWLSLVQSYQPAAFWFWNTRMTRGGIEESIQKMTAAGIREFVIHPIHGLEPEYLSQDYLECLHYALDLARGHAMKVWIYDEYGWPSGVVGGKLLQLHPEHRGWYLSFSRDVGGLRIEPRQSDRVLDNVMGASWTNQEPGYLDTLSPAAVRCFIEMTHEKLYAACRDYFGPVIVGFFTDEPVAMMDANTGQPGGWMARGLPWTPAFPEQFRKRFGYDIEPRYSELAGNGPSRCKSDYWTLVKDMHVDAYHGQIGRWCQDHGVKYSGHLGEDYPLQQVRFAGSAFGALSHMDEPGVDFLGWQHDADQRLADLVLVPSIARHTGKQRVFCEAFGISRFDLRLGSMLRTAQMLGLNGIDHIALMGFSQGLDGMRKYLYWPPLFWQAPWWDFFPDFRDALARSVGLTALGRRHTRYAVVYPQNELEQTDVFFTDLSSGKDPGTALVEELGRAVYECGECFDFVFPEMLDQFRIDHGRVVFPFADYQAILAPRDVRYFDTTTDTLDRMAAGGGKILRGPRQELIALLKECEPSWANRLQIQRDASCVRVYWFEFTDGELYVLRNAGNQNQTVRVLSQDHIAQWQPQTGDVRQWTPEGEHTMPAHSCLYLTRTQRPLASRPVRSHPHTTPMVSPWRIHATSLNTARLGKLQFCHEQLGWLDAVANRVTEEKTPRHAIGLPDEFRSHTAIAFRAEFACNVLPPRLGVLFERDRLDALAINDQPIDRSPAETMRTWDAGVSWLDIRPFTHAGPNRITGILKFDRYETTVTNHAFFANGPMPACNVYVAGSFRVLRGTLHDPTNEAFPLPVRLDEIGWDQYHGELTLEAETHIDAEWADRIMGIQVEPIAEDGLELWIDGVSLGRLICFPYEFDCGRLTAGSHRLQVRISGTSGNLLYEPSPWGLSAVRWICR